MLKRVNFPLLASAAMLVCVPYLMSNAADDAKPAPAATAMETAEPFVDLSNIEDPAFDRYVDLVLLGTAWDTLDAGLLTDCALQLAEGERILMRSHKAINSKQVLALAVKVAAEKRDAAALDRLASVADNTKNTAIGDQIASAKKLAGQSRKVDPAASISATETTPEQLALYQEAINGVKAAGIVGDKDYLKNLEAGLADKESVLASLSDTQRAYLKKIMGETQQIMPKEANAELSDTLAKLKGVSRGNFGFGVGSIVNGINSIQNGNRGHGVGSIINGIGHIATSGHSYNSGYRPPYTPNYGYNPYRPSYPPTYGYIPPYRPTYGHNTYRPTYGHNWGHGHSGHNHGWRFP